MAEKRKDSRGRILKENECQRPDGKYEYKYTQNGQRKSVYSWKLVPTDKLPAGKRSDLSLREKEKAILKDLDDGINTITASKMSMNELFYMYLDSKTKLKDKSRRKYMQLWEMHVKENRLGKMALDSIKKAHIQRFYSELSTGGLSDATVRMYHNNLIRPALEFAVDNDLIRKNPTKGCLEDYQGARKREALTRKEQQIFLDYIKNSKYFSHYFPMIQIMLGTACRIGEICGLTWKDVDFKNKEIHIDHQLSYEKVDGKMQRYISEPKTESGKRIIGMTTQVYQAFIEQKRLDVMLGRRSSLEIDGYKNFVFINSRSMPYSITSFNAILYGIVKNYNEEELKNAKKEKRSPVLLPKISNHILRHTGCTRMAEAGIDPKVLQVIMGHSDPAVTMKVYNHVDRERMKREIRKIEYVV